MTLINITVQALQETQKNKKRKRRRSESTQVARNSENKESDSSHSIILLPDEPIGRAPTAIFSSVVFRFVLQPQ